MENKSSKDLELQQVANSEAKVWESSAYYNDAEQWTWLFWSDEHQFRRLFNQLDLTITLELACGYGRHSEHLLDHFGQKINHLTMMDILESNIEHCRNRIGKRENVSFVVNDGAGFKSVEASSLTSIYCYDAMVHFNHEVVESYLKDTFRVLSAGGRALFHHSNNSQHNNKHFGMNPHARAFMPVGLFKQYAEAAGLKVCEQVVISWGDVENLDCISLLEKSA
jgi:ubiquinone/menaquinone biosynthesis C-methylase UbiE